MTMKNTQLLWTLILAQNISTAETLPLAYLVQSAAISCVNLLKSQLLLKTPKEATNTEIL